MKTAAMSKVTKELRVHTVVLIVLVIASIFAYTFYVDIKGIKTTISSTQSYNADLEFDAISSKLDDSVSKAKIQTSLIAEIISKDIKYAYQGDVATLKKDLSFADPSVKLYNIISEDIASRYINKDTSLNKILVISNGKIMSTSFKSNTTFTRGQSIYDFFALQSDDKNLSRIIKRTNDYAIIGGSTDIVDVSTLKDIYNTKGLEGLRDYYLLVPAYITDDGDILGVRDLDSTGVPQSNNKMIVIQHMSIYDALMYQDSILQRFTDSETNMRNEYNHRITMGYFRNYVTLGLGVILALLALTKWHNTNITE